MSDSLVTESLLMPVMADGQLSQSRVLDNIFDVSDIEGSSSEEYDISEVSTDSDSDSEPVIRYVRQKNSSNNNNANSTASTSTSSIISNNRPTTTSPPRASTPVSVPAPNPNPNVR